MTTESLLALDCCEDGSKELLQKALRKMKPLERYADKDGDIPLEKLESLLKAMCRKYCVRMQYIIFSVNENGMITYNMSVKRDDTHSWLGTVYGLDIYETFCKAAILIYSSVKKQEIPERSGDDW